MGNIGNNAHAPVDMTEISVDDYSKIIVFQDEQLFKGVLEANPHLKAVYGERELDKELFPELYIAGVT